MAGDSVLAGELAHPLQIAMAFLDRRLKIDPRQFFPEGAQVEIAFDLADAGELLLPPRPPTVSERCAFHLSSH